MVATSSQSVLDPSASAVAFADIPSSERVACRKCPGRPRPQVGLGYVQATPAIADLAFLYDWSRHEA
jgi:hypothetical protein